MILFVIVECEVQATTHSSLDMINSLVKFDKFDAALM